MRVKWFSFVRVVGLTLVLSYHFFQNQYTGGFLGVDIFFTFSGYLITALMIDEFGKTGQFRLFSFYKRRFRRIVPPLFLSVILVMPFTLLVNRDYLTNIGRQIAAALGFTTNYFEILTGGSYENKFIPHLFVHTWSLAIEMQFYLVWGLIVFLLGITVRHFVQSRTRALAIFENTVLWSSLLLSIASFATMFLRARGLTDYSQVYFSSITHGYPFFVGSVVGCLAGIKTVRPAFERTIKNWNLSVAVSVMVISSAALIGLGCYLKFDHLQTYQGGLLLSTVLAGLMIYAARILHEKTPNSDEPQLITYIADVSYSVYLFHWPLYVIFSQLMPNLAAVALTVVVSFALSSLSYYVLEPIMIGHTGRWFKHSVTWKQVRVPFMTALVLLIGTTAYATRLAPQMTTLENNLWVGDLYQDVDQMNMHHSMIMAATKPTTQKVNGAGQPVPAGMPKGVSIIGDSVTLGTRSYLGAHVKQSSIDAEGDRTMDLAYKVMKQEQQSGILRQTVVICIGTNALDDYKEQTMNIVHALAPGHRLVLMTPYNAKAAPDWNSSKLATYERTLPAKYPYITIADWETAAAKHPEVFKGTDGVHFGGIHAGDVLYAQVVNSALQQADKTPLKK
ncbi:acyltransferase family protein [Levilactobacillus bambusae]|uniref:Acyltransferase n=1 Tax=Levilactobacillus bambusae TaxID=2024736 RepID=A0A2V1MZU9_9LACO|nr:acyltransferase family protein [Levilactobacillus bambusae]PWG00018.1 acyltransferase [Levilactobacillus bambusae]